jgi:hypothetical protein
MCKDFLEGIFAHGLCVITKAQTTQAANDKGPKVKDDTRAKVLCAKSVMAEDSGHCWGHVYRNSFSGKLWPQ